MIYKEFSHLAPQIQQHVLKAQKLLNKLVFKYSKDFIIITIYVNPDSLQITDEKKGIATYCHFKLIRTQEGIFEYNFDYLSNVD